MGALWLSKNTLLSDPSRRPLSSARYRAAILTSGFFLLLEGSRAGCPLTLEDTCCDLEFEGLIRSEGKEDAFLAQDE